MIKVYLSELSALQGFFLYIPGQTVDVILLGNVGVEQCPPGILGILGILGTFWACLGIARHLFSIRSFLFNPSGDSYSRYIYRINIYIMEVGFGSWDQTIKTTSTKPSAPSFSHRPPPPPHPSRPYTQRAADSPSQPRNQPGYPR